MRADAGFVLLGLALVGCVETSVPDRTEVAADTSPAAVPLRLAGPGDAALLVRVRLNGRGPYDFILDTGATLTCVDAALADSLGLQEARGRLGIGAGLQGEPGSIRLVEIDSIAVGSSRAEGLTGCTVDLGQFRAMGLAPRGLLGLNFLTSYRVILDSRPGTSPSSGRSGVSQRARSAPSPRTRTTQPTSEVGAP